MISLRLQLPDVTGKIRDLYGIEPLDFRFTFEIRNLRQSESVWNGDCPSPKNGVIGARNCIC